mmetsp:Transcript_3252/g.7050  ORF Transcript_3252/g.7050 Transcript_3252/m.7050 type:complete len:201 (+) Transcript_3252:224-826(+)
MSASGSVPPSLKRRVRTIPHFSAIALTGSCGRWASTKKASSRALRRASMLSTRSSSSTWVSPRCSISSPCSPCKPQWMVTWAACFASARAARARTFRCGASGLGRRVFYYVLSHSSSLAPPPSSPQRREAPCARSPTRATATCASRSRTCSSRPTSRCTTFLASKPSRAMAQTGSSAWTSLGTPPSPRTPRGRRPPRRPR